jgi:hypothetical protein
MYSSYSFLTSAPDDVSGQSHGPAVLYPRETAPVPTGQEAVWPSELSEHTRAEEKSFATTGERTPVVQSVVSNTILIEKHT